MISGVLLHSEIIQSSWDNLLYHHGDSLKYFYSAFFGWCCACLHCLLTNKAFADVYYETCIKKMKSFSVALLTSMQVQKLMKLLKLLKFTKGQLIPL